MLEDKGQAIEHLEDQLASYQKYQALYSSLKEEFTELAGKQNELEIELSDAQRSRDEAVADNKELQYKTQKLGTLEKACTSTEKENQ